MVDISCFGLADGEIYATGSGNPPFSYEWTTGEETAEKLTAEMGWHYLTLTDNYGCVKVDSLWVNEPDELVLTSYASSDVAEMENGTGWVEVVGGVADYTYLWDDPLAQVTDTAWALADGIWTVTVTDENGCVACASVEIKQVAGIEEMNENQFTIFPHPATDYFQLTGVSNASSITKIELIDMQGRLVDLTDITVSKSSSTCRLLILEFI